MRTRRYLGKHFEVWNRGQAWFWMVGDPHRERAAIGASASESDAIREACLQIEEMLPPRAGDTIPSGTIT